MEKTNNMIIGAEIGANTHKWLVSEAERRNMSMRKLIKLIIEEKHGRITSQRNKSKRS